MVWQFRQDNEEHVITSRDEALRDGGQGEIARSASAAIQHILDTHSWYDMMTIGWPYTNPADREAADYLRTHLPALSQTEGYSDLTKDKFWVYTLVHRGKEATPAQVNEKTPFGMMLCDLENHTQSYGTINILTKARVSDLKDFGEEVTSDSINADMAHTMQLLKHANPNIKLEIALEHIYTAWLEEDNQEENRKHIINTIVTGLLKGAKRITVPDTDGAHKPKEIKAVLGKITEALQTDERLLAAGLNFNPAMFIAHMHDDRGYGALNAEAAFEAGARCFDSTPGIMGERRGNVTLGQMGGLLDHPHQAEMLRYQHGFERKFGIRRGDKDIGTYDAYTATGGMHGDHLWKEWKRTNKSLEDFLRKYDRSYASYPPSRVGQSIHIGISPVAGASNILLAIASLGMGLGIENKQDPRIVEVLTEVKRGEHEDGINYRGANNANAMLLIADRFGLRECPDPEGKKTVRRNRIKLSAERVLTSIEDKGPLHYEDQMCGVKLSLSDNGPKVKPIEFRDPVIHWLDTDETHWMGNDLKAAKHAYAVILAVKDLLSKADERFNDITLEEARCYETHAGKLTADQGDPLNPVQKRMRQVVSLRCTMGKGQEVYQANGVGNTYEDAIVMAVQTLFDFKCFQIERELKARGESGLLHSHKLRVRAERVAAYDLGTDFGG